ncbi:hypothetical protein BKA56DRAFT_625006 [Ilyonectria sp. MPI-CAGE-AT-0026]|nr:hypothetical protein BKA56DRAFT_625006 [Ilyonectria sp. MPI-CAGE-AT-0026]
MWWLMDDYHAALLTSLIAVWLSFAWKSVFRIAKYFIVISLRQIPANSDVQENQEGQPLLPTRDGETGTTTPQNVTEVLERSDGGAKLIKHIEKYVSQRRSRHKTVSIVFGLFFFAMFLGWVIFGIYSAMIKTDNAALWASNHCGIFVFDADHAGEGAATRADVRGRNKESRAGEYAKSCYQLPEDSILQTKDCGFFYQPFIPFTNKTTYECPFRDPKICAPDTQAITFDTGLVDASRIGVNDPITYKFSRSTTCVPLNNDYPYVQREDRNGTPTFTYHYGEIVDEDGSTNYTFSSAGDPFDMLAPAYNVSAYATSWYPEYDYWKPRPELTPPENSTLTLLFISALHILYLDSSSDPIFGADEKYLFEGEPRPWWYKSDPRSGVLACIDYHQLCSPDGKSCWSVTEDRENLPPGYWLMRLSMEAASNIYDSIVGRLGSALIAQERVSQSTSDGLRNDHWKLEAARLFATSLARIQYEAWSIASGEDRREEGFVDVTPDEAGDLCGIFKFKSVGYENIDVLWLVILSLLSPLLWILSQEVRDVRDRRDWAWAFMKDLYSGQRENGQQDEERNSDVENNPWTEDEERPNLASENQPGQQETGDDTGENRLGGPDDDILVLYFIICRIWTFLFTSFSCIVDVVKSIWQGLPKLRGD